MEQNFRQPYSVSGQTELLWKATTTRQANTTNNTTREKEMEAELLWKATTTHLANTTNNTTREKEMETLRKKEPTVDHNDDINRGIRYSSQGKE